MKLEISLKEVQEFIINHYHANVGLENIDENKIKINYFASLILTIKEVKEDEVRFYYEVNGFVNLLAKGAHFLLKKRLDNIPMEWNSNTRIVTIYLKKIDELRELSKFLYISELRLINENILLIFNIKYRI